MSGAGRVAGSGRTYDKIANVYDDTRTFPPDVSGRITKGLLELSGATAAGRVLEVGVGTGRIGLPFMKAGIRYVGLDLSEPMLRRLTAKAGRYPPGVVRGDVSRLPFLPDSFDAVLSCHVLHYAPDLGHALTEIMRVLSPGGMYLHCHNPLPEHHQEVDRLWQETVGEFVPGFEPATSYDMADDRIVRWLTARAGKVATTEITRWPIRQSLAELVDAYRKRAYPTCWLVPGDRYDQAIIRFENRCRRLYGSSRHTVESHGFLRVTVATPYQDRPGRRP